MYPEQPSDWRPTDAPSAPAPTSHNSTRDDRLGRGRQRASLAATIMTVALLGAIVGVAADRYISANPNPAVLPIAAIAPTTSSPGASATPATGGIAAAPTPGSAPRIGPRATGQQAPSTTAPSTALSNDPQIAAIQAVIQKGDQEQQDAFGSGNPGIMADTSTADFYQQQAQTNQDLKNNGVSAIKLVSIEWGPATVSGTNATATAWETWSTTYSDGTTEQSRDRNEYVLVQDSGTWKVSADTHPDDPYSSTAPGGPAPGQSDPTQPSPPRTPGQTTPSGQPGQPSQPQPSRPRRQGNPNTSQNWSGYAASGGVYTAVSGTWTVPEFSPTSTAGADAAWVGIGGTTSSDLIQAGTQQTVSGSGTTHYEAWVEMLPQASHPVPLTVNPGDSITVSITQQGAPDQWLIAMTNNTTGQTFQVDEQYTSSMSSAEWIEEAPSALRGRQIPLDDFGTIAFSAGSATKDGRTVTVAGAGGQAITMVGRGGQTLASPSAISADGTSFTVSRG